MKEQEFKTQIIQTKEQWDSGFRHRLDELKDGGITLYSVPYFNHWIEGLKGIGNISGLAVDACGQIYFMDGKGQIYRYSQMNKTLEKIDLIGEDKKMVTFKSPAKIIINKSTLWVLDSGSKRVQAFSLGDFQFTYSIEDKLNEPVDIGLREEGFLYVLYKTDKNTGIILQYDIHHKCIKSRFGEKKIKNPVCLAIAKDTIYVIDYAKEVNRFLRFTEKTMFDSLIPPPHTDIDILNKYKPSLIAVDTKGKIFINEKEPGLIHQYDPDGEELETITVPGFTGAKITGLALDYKGNLYVSDGNGIAVLGTHNRFPKKGGAYYSKVLDSGKDDCRWHRLFLDADIPPKTLLKVSYYAFNGSTEKKRLDELIRIHARSSPGYDKGSPGKKESITDIDKFKILTELADPVKSRQEFFLDVPLSTSGENPKDLLFHNATGRYLCLKMELSTYNEEVCPKIYKMKMYYERISYLRYLPAIYQENEGSKEFLERFLSLFESIFHDLENEIEQSFQYFDPCSVPKEALAWLASWLNLALEEGWPEEKKRILVREAFTLYKKKGTPEGMRRFIEIVTGERPVIVEHARMGKPMVLGSKFNLGVDSMIFQSPVKGLLLGGDSILRRVALRNVVQSLEDPFLPVANRFTIIINASVKDSERYKKSLEHILHELKPAHTRYYLRFFEETRFGRGNYLGINARLGDILPIRLGDDMRLGSGVISGHGE